MIFQSMTSNSLAWGIIFFNIALGLTIFFKYRPISWPGGVEALGCLGSLVLLSLTLLLL
jgi:hypothetical protein